MTLSSHTYVTPRTVPWHLVGDTDGPVDMLVVVLHGLGERAIDVARALEPAAAPGRVLLLPEGLSRSLPRPMAPRAGASWSTGDDAGIDLADNLRYLDGLLGEVRLTLRPRRLRLVGFSQGGLTAARWVAHRTHPWEQVVLWAAALPGDVDPAALRAGLGAAGLVMVLGDADPMVTPQARSVVRDRLDALGLPWRLHPFAGGHELPPAVLSEVLR